MRDLGGMTVEEAEQRMSGYEFTRWAGYYRFVESEQARLVERAQREAGRKRAAAQHARPRRGR